MANEPAATSVVKIENDRVRVTEWSFVPGAATGWHRHAYDYVIVPLTSGRLKLVDVELNLLQPFKPLAVHRQPLLAQVVSHLLRAVLLRRLYVVFEVGDLLFEPGGIRPFGRPHQLESVAQDAEAAAKRLFSQDRYLQQRERVRLASLPDERLKLSKGVLEPTQGPDTHLRVQPGKSLLQLHP